MAADDVTADDPETWIAAWLAEHPDFLVRHPETLAALDVPHGCHPARSLIECQVRILRRQLAAERQRLAHLIARAHEYAELSARLHQIVLQLIGTDDPAQVWGILRDVLPRELHAEAVALRLFDLTPDAGPPDDPLTLALHDFLDRERVSCGPLTAERARLLFGADGATIQAAALIPIHAGERSGLLAIGSADAARFHPDLSTELLDRLGELLSHKLRVTPLWTDPADPAEPVDSTH